MASISSLMTVKKGFTLIELVIAIAIIGILSVWVAPFFQQPVASKRKQFVADLNEIVLTAWQHAIITHQVHRLLFDFEKRSVVVEQAIPNTKKFESMQGVNSEMSWSDTIIIKQFLINGFDEMERFSGRRTKTVWFYVIPDGMTQQVTINGIDKQERQENKFVEFGLVLNPFLAQFKEYDTFQK